MEKKNLVVIDGNSLMNRAFYALPPMNNSKGIPTGAMYGFLMMLFKINDDINPDYIITAFDRKAPTFRHIEYAEYKAGRKKMPDDLAAQFEPLKEILKAFNIGIYEIDGFEADDIIGTVSKRYEAEDCHVYIYTGDRDELQLISPYTTVVITKKGITETDVFDEKFLLEKYGLTPPGVIEIKGLMGDASDNIPGVPGVGEKTAHKLLSQFGTIENIYKNIDKISSKKIANSLIQNKEDAFFSRKLATIDRNVPIEIDLDSIKLKDYDASKVRNLFIEYEFNSLIGKIKKDDSVQSIEKPIIADYTKDEIENIKNNGVLNFLPVYKDKKLGGVIINGGCFVPADNIMELSNIFVDRSIVKNTFSCKPVYNIFKSKNIDVSPIEFDAEIAAYLLNPSESKYDIRNILSRYADVNVPDSFDEAEAGSLFIQNMDIIKESMMAKIKELGMLDLFEKVEMPLFEVLSYMECTGFKVNRDTLNDIGFQLSEEIDVLTGEIYDMAGEEFNINSPKQLGVILFEKLKLPVIKKTKTGYSTNAEVLEELSSKNEIVEKILSYRQLTKLKSTYIDGLMAAVKDDGRIHSSFNQTVTATGRISSTEPNLQNIPVKMEQGKRIRKAFVPESDKYVILSGDYSQIELRVLAHISQDENLVDAFNKGQDIHAKTASQIFGVPMDEVTPIERRKAKTVNFGIIYGLSDYGLSKDLKISRKEAKLYIDNYFMKYSGVKNYLESAVKSAKENGYVKTILNRIRYIPEINSSNKMVRNLGERLAMNTPIQGSAADIIKIAMVHVYNRMKNEKLKSRLLLQVHDELIIETHIDELEYMKKLLKDEMENAVKLSVPLIVDINWGKNWYDAK